MLQIIDAVAFVAHGDCRSHVPSDWGFYGCNRTLRTTLSSRPLSESVLPVGSLRRLGGVVSCDCRAHRGGVCSRGPYVTC